MNGSLWTLPEDDARHGFGGNQIIERNLAGENLHQRMRLLGMKRIHRLPQS